ncbi:MAG: B12-binding domain-containing radical SAM protein [Verrucomicrobiota bacterium]|jgi:radical SAM superfamily enzyme YgiQ (UPF0313 family)
MAHRLLIIQPSYYRSRADRTVFKVRRRQVVPLTLPYLAALTPAHWEIKLLDEQLEPIDFDCPADLVAITTWTLNSYRAYDIADEFRRRGVPVMLGGPHTFFHAGEAGEHCDAVGIGEAEGIWTQMLEDALQGRLKQIYRADLRPDLAGLPRPRYELLNLRRYGPFKTFTVSASRGCPFRCEFCSERFLLGETYRCRPVPEVVEEIKHWRLRNILFGDSNFGGKRSHAMELMEALVPLKVRWSALWSSYLCNDREFLDLAQRSGLLHVNIGIESINPDTLEDMHKRFNKTSRYEEMLANLRRRGISYSLNFIFGWDGETEGAVRATLKFLRHHKVPAAYFNILTPVKGTPLYDRLQGEDRITDNRNIDRWPGQLCYIKPPYGSPAELEQNVRKMYRDFYSLPSIVSRMPLPVTKANMASWVINISQRRMACTRPANNNFDGY